MTVDPENFKDDPRSPQVLAKAILDHPLIPSDRYDPSYNFRESLLLDNGTESEKKHAPGLVTALKNLEDAVSCDHLDQRHLSHALQVINAYRKEAENFRGMAELDANYQAPEELSGLPPARREQMLEFHRDAAGSMEKWTVEKIHLGAIEKLVRQLAQKIGVSLIEPRRRR